VTNLNAYLVQVARGYNAGLPQKLDEMTSVVRVDAGDAALIFVHQTSVEISTQEQINTIASVVGPKACSDQMIRQNVNVYRVKHTYRYFTPSGRYVDIFLNPGSC
jgi:hypothetical protein